MAIFLNKIMVIFMCAAFNTYRAGSSSTIILHAEDVKIRTQRHWVTVQRDSTTWKQSRDLI